MQLMDALISIAGDNIASILSERALFNTAGNSITVTSLYVSLTREESDTAAGARCLPL